MIFLILWLLSLAACLGGLALPKFLSRRALLNILAGLAILLIVSNFVTPIFNMLFPKNRQIEIGQIFRRPADTHLALELGVLTDSFATEGHYGGVLRQYYVEEIRQLIPGETNYNQETTTVLWSYRFIPHSIAIRGDMMIVSGIEEQNDDVVFILIPKEILDSVRTFSFETDVIKK